MTALPTAENGGFGGMLSGKGIRNAALIDDAYDPVSASDVEAEDLLSLLRGSQEAADAAVRCEIDVDAVDSLTSDRVTALRDAADGDPHLRDLWEQSLLGQRVSAQYRQVRRIAEALRRAGLRVTENPTTVSVDTIRDADVVFLDYRFADDDSLASVRKARDIVTQWPPEQPKPILVLMSSRDNVASEAENFSRTAQVIAGLFHAVPKAQLSDDVKVRIHLTVFAASLPAGRLVQTFLDSVRAGIHQATEDFANAISELTLSDYAYVQKLSLQKDGHPLGDYLLWLFGEYFSHLIVGPAIRKERAALDALTFDAPLPMSAKPSKRLAELYHVAVFDANVGPVQEHPHAAGESADQPRHLLNLGDVFEKNKAVDARVSHNSQNEEAIKPNAKTTRTREPDLRVVINPACDLALSPGIREVDCERAMLLLPGYLQPLTSPLADSQKEWPRTELYLRDDDAFRVVWNPKRLEAVTFGDFPTWAAANHLRRATRLKLPYALELQQVFASTLTRVGMPVPPPLYHSADVSWLRNINGMFAEWDLAEGERDIVVLTRGGEKQCVMTLPLVLAVRRLMEEHVAKLRERVQDEKDAKPQGALNEVIGSLGRHLDNEAKWLEMLQPQRMPTSKSSVKLLSGFFELRCGATIGSSAGKLIGAISFQELSDAR